MSGRSIPSYEACMSTAHAVTLSETRPNAGRVLEITCMSQISSLFPPCFSGTQPIGAFVRLVSTAPGTPVRRSYVHDTTRIRSLSRDTMLEAKQVENNEIKVAKVTVEKVGAISLLHDNRAIPRLGCKTTSLVTFPTSQDAPE